MYAVILKPATIISRIIKLFVATHIKINSKTISKKSKASYDHKQLEKFTKSPIKKKKIKKKKIIKNLFKIVQLSNCS